MLVKVGDAEIKETQFSGKSGSAGSSSEATIGSFTMPYQGKVAVSLNTTGDNTGKVRLYVDNVKIYEGGVGYTFNKTIPDIIPAGSSVSVRIISNSGTLPYNTASASTVKYRMSINPFECTPDSVREIGNLATCFVYGVDKNGTYKGGIIVGTTETRTTGNITLGNCVGFLEINYNGEIVKVPYYN